MQERVRNAEAATDLKVIGTRPIRPDGVDKVTGRARFGADYNLPGQLIGKVLRSPYPHARIKRIDTSKAAALPGVKAIVTRDDFPDQPAAARHGSRFIQLRRSSVLLLVLQPLYTLCLQRLHHF